MTTAYDRLADSPQTGVDVGELTPAERTDLRRLRIGRHSDANQAVDGQFTTVYYLAGDDRAAAKTFVEHNRRQLAAIDFSHPDPVQRAVPRPVYDWILHFLGERTIRKYAAVVYERRPDGREWVIDRERFESRPTRRYALDQSYNVCVEAGTSTEALFSAVENPITESALRDRGGVVGAVEYLLEYYRVAGPYDCRPTTVDGELAVVRPADAPLDPSH